MSQYKRREQLAQNYSVRDRSNSNNQLMMENKLNISKQTTQNQNNNYYSIEGQLAQYAESRIVSGNTSTLLSKPNSFQLSSQQQSSITSTITNPSNINTNHHPSSLLLLSTETNNRRQRINKLQVISGGDSRASNSNRQSSVNNNNSRSASINRGGIRVVSRGSTVEKREESCQGEKISGEGVLRINDGDGKQDKKESSAGMFGISCRIRSPFTQAQQLTQLTIPHNIHSSTNSNPQPLTPLTNPISTSHRLPTHHQPQIIIYKQLRQLMQKQMMVSRKMYQKRCMDEVQSMSIIYQGQIETLQRVLAENQTVMEEQQRKVERLEEKCARQEGRIAAYAQRLESITKYIQSTNKFALTRLSEAQLKLTLFLTDLHQPQPLSSPFPQHPSPILFASKLQHLQFIFTTLLTQTIIKYRNIQFQIKQQIKDVMKRYEYFQQRIYQMELMKHLGKENQIQNYKLREKIDDIKGQLVVLQERGKCHVTGNTNNMYDDTSINNIQQFNHFKTTIYKLQAQVEFWEKNQNQMFDTINKLEVDKYRLMNRVNELSQEVGKWRDGVERVKAEEMGMKRMQCMQEQQQKGYNSQQKVPQSPQRYQFSSDKQSLYLQSEQKQSFPQLRKQISRLNELIDQYECKIQQLHTSIQQLQEQNSNLLNDLKKRILEQKKQQLSMDQSTIMRLNHLIQEKQGKIMELQFIIDEKEMKLQQMESKLLQQQGKLIQTLNNLQQANRQHAQLSQALQMTENIFDQQIQKFKSTIQHLQQQNQQLLYQLNQFRGINYNTSHHSKWFKRSQKRENQIGLKSTTGNNKMMYREVLSPTNSYQQYENQQLRYCQQEMSGGKDEFFYPQQQQQLLHHRSYSMQHSADSSTSAHNNPNTNQKLINNRIHSVSSNNINQQYQQSSRYIF